MKTRTRILLSFLTLVGLLLAACGPTTSTPAPVSAPTETPSIPSTPLRASPSPPAEVPAALPTPAAPVSAKPVFALFEEPAVEAVPAVRHEPIAPDLSNVRAPLALSEAQRERLAQDGFVVSPSVEKEFFTVYEKARYANVPIFVTSDSLLHVYHLLFDKVLRTAEIQYFIPLLRDLNQAMLAQTDSQYQVLQGTGWEGGRRPPHRGLCRRRQQAVGPRCPGA